MSVNGTRLRSLVHYWPERTNPEGQTPRAVLYLAEEIGADPNASNAELAFAAALVQDVYGTLGWRTPPSQPLSRCHSVAASVRHSTHILTQHILGETQNVGGTVAILGDFGFAQAVFERPDVVAPRGALLVPLNGAEPAQLSAITLGNTSGVHWASPGRLADILERECHSFEMGGKTFLLPSSQIVFSLSAPAAAAGDPAALLCFAAAEHQLTHAEGEGRHTIPDAQLADQASVARACRRLGIGTEGHHLPRALERLGDMIHQLANKIAIS
jgi:hypothetical protein